MHPFPNSDPSGVERDQTENGWQWQGHTTTGGGIID